MSNSGSGAQAGGERRASPGTTRSYSRGIFTTALRIVARKWSRSSGRSRIVSDAPFGFSHGSFSMLHINASWSDIRSVKRNSRSRAAM